MRPRTAKMLDDFSVGAARFFKGVGKV